MATSVLEHDQVQNPAVDWSNIRPVYQKLHSEFHILTAPFGIHIGKQLDQDLAHLISAVDVVDRILDEIAVAQDRKKFATQVVDFLRVDGAVGLDGNPTGEIVSGTPELSRRLSCLREMIKRRGIRQPFLETVARIFENTEGKRQARSSGQMVEHLITEWNLTGRLPVLFLGNHGTTKFEKFFFLCCEMMAAVDTIQDARLDFHRGQISIRPGPLLYARLLAVCLLRMPRLFLRFPRPASLWRYTISFLREDFSPGL